MNACPPVNLLHSLYWAQPKLEDMKGFTCALHKKADTTAASHLSLAVDIFPQVTGRAKSWAQIELNSWQITQYPVVPYSLKASLHLQSACKALAFLRIPNFCSQIQPVSNWGQLVCNLTYWNALGSSPSWSCLWSSIRSPEFSSYITENRSTAFDTLVPKFFGNLTMMSLIPGCKIEIRRLSSIYI